MENQVDAKQAKLGNEKKPYEAPMLTKLGTVEQLTKGGPPVTMSDNGVGSF